MHRLVLVAASVLQIAWLIRWLAYALINDEPMAVYEIFTNLGKRKGIRNVAV